MPPKLSIYTVAWSLVGVFVVYTIYVLLSGLGYNPLGGHWDFSISGPFGDSFGPLNSVFALVAAISATAAFLDQRKELRRVKDLATEERAAASKRDFEQTFFNLLNLFKETLGAISLRCQDEDEIKFGPQAINLMIYDQMLTINGDYGQDQKNYMTLYGIHRDTIAHYFRLFYHILKYIDESIIPDKILYSRLLRATLSQSELTLIALNCMHGGGRRKLTPLVNKYAMLHNISSSIAKDWKMNNFFDDQAFGERTMSDWESK